MKIGHELAMCDCSPESQPCAGLIPSSMGSRVNLPLCFTKVRPHLQCCLQLWDLLCMKDTDLSEWVQRRPQEMFRGLEHLTFKDRLR